MLKIPNLHNWIADLPSEVRKAVFDRMVTRHFKAQDEIYRVREEAVGIYLVDSGMIRLGNYTQSGREILIIDFYENECFGEVGVIDEQLRISNAYCVTDATIRFLSKKAFWDLYETYPEIPKQLNLFLCRRTQMLVTLAEEVSGLNLRERLVRLLLRLAASRGSPEDGCVWLSGISHEILANRTGATRQAVSRELKILERENLIKLEYGRLAVTGLWGQAESYEKLLGGESMVPDYKTNNKSV